LHHLQYSYIKLRGLKHILFLHDMCFLQNLFERMTTTQLLFAQISTVFHVCFKIIVLTSLHTFKCFNIQPMITRRFRASLQCFEQYILFVISSVTNPAQSFTIQGLCILSYLPHDCNSHLSFILIIFI